MGWTPRRCERVLKDSCILSRGSNGIQWDVCEFVHLCCLYRQSPHFTAARSEWPRVRRGSGFNSKFTSGGHWELKQVVEGLIKDEHMQPGTSNFREWHTAADSAGLSSRRGFLSLRNFIAQAKTPLIVN